MSIELLPPTPKYPNSYHVRTNYCQCHPETCCCNDWAVHDHNGEKHSTYFYRKDADGVANDLNNDDCLQYRDGDKCLEEMDSVANQATPPALNTPIKELIKEYEAEECNFNDIDYVKNTALRYAQTMPDDLTRCLLYVLAGGEF